MHGPGVDSAIVVDVEHVVQLIVAAVQLVLQLHACSLGPRSDRYPVLPEHPDEYVGSYGDDK